ncbi:hypothetical protein KFL_008580020 [Klebsormidium nitens]|uniref:Telomere-associated protein Rif1 N-terminal domain-containing protein n=1 Tax=Klebsormidium nitens TaxID=105231 RepID=A0A1Y1IMD3_KLENI|nr:hypothetical protein KFL_008580020 [Klebsormidium nitens]|eukprot:GAQ91803.1 hypothetical protein KFL_008580020 [Klebsormidium nitens]
MNSFIDSLRLPLAADTDARAQVYEALLSHQQAADVTMASEPMTKDHLRQILPSLVADIAHADEALASSAVKCLGFNLHQSNFVSMVGEAKVKGVVEALVALVTKTGSKVICSLGLWCLQGNSLPPCLVAPHMSGLVMALVRAIDNPWGSVTCVYKAQLLTAKLVRQVPAEMEAYASVWGPKLAGTLLSEVKRVRETGDEVLREAQAILLQSEQSLSEAITANVNPQYLARILALARAAGTEQAALTAWSWQVRLSGELLITKDMLINKLLPVLECTFGSALPAVREASFTAWRALIDVLTQPYVSTSRDAQNSPPSKAGAGVKSPVTPKAREGGHVAPSVRRLKLLMTPLLANLGQESEAQVRLVCIRTWEYLLRRLAHWLKSSSVFQLIAQPVYSVILAQPGTPKAAQEKDPALYRNVLGQFLAFLGVPHSETKPLSTNSPGRAAEQTGDARGGEEALEVPWDLKQVGALLDILGLVREQAVLDGSITALEVPQAAKAQEGRLESSGVRSPASPLLPPAISGAAVDASGPKGLAGKRVGAPGPVTNKGHVSATDEGHVSAGEALLSGWVALVKGVARAGRKQMRPSEEHVAAVRGLITFAAETMSRVGRAGGQPVPATWQLVRVLMNELTSIVLASVSYGLPLPDGFVSGGGQKAQSPDVSTPGASKVGAAELFTPAAFLLAVTLANGSPPQEAIQEPVQPGHEELKPAYERVQTFVERVKGPVSELVELSCGRLDILGGALRLVRVLEILAGLPGSQSPASAPPPRTADVMLMLTWQEVAKQVTRFVVRSNDVPIAQKGAAGQAVFGVLLLPLRVLGVGGLTRGLGGGFLTTEGLDAALREWALLWEAAYRVTQLKNLQSNLLFHGFCSRLLRVVRSDLRTEASLPALFSQALSACLSTLVSHLEIASPSSLAMSKKRRRVSSAPLNGTPPKDALFFLGKTLDDQNGVQDLAAILGHALQVAAAHWAVHESDVSGLMSVLTSLLGKLSAQADVLLVLQPQLSPVADWLALTHSWKPPPVSGSQAPDSQPTQDVHPVLMSLTALWNHLLTALEKCHPRLEFDSQTLLTLSPLLEHSMAHSHQPIANRALSFWESTFAKPGGSGTPRTEESIRGSHAKVSQGRSQTQGVAGELIYPAELVPILTRLRSKVDITLPGWNAPDLAALQDDVKRPQEGRSALEQSEQGSGKWSHPYQGDRSAMGLNRNGGAVRSSGVGYQGGLLPSTVRPLGAELKGCRAAAAGDGSKAAETRAEGLGTGGAKCSEGVPGLGQGAALEPAKDPNELRTYNTNAGAAGVTSTAGDGSVATAASEQVARQSGDLIAAPEGEVVAPAAIGSGIPIPQGESEAGKVLSPSREPRRDLNVAIVPPVERECDTADAGGKSANDKRTPKREDQSSESGKRTGEARDPAPEAGNRSSGTVTRPTEGGSESATKLEVGGAGDKRRKSEGAERTPERERTRLAVAGRPGSAEAAGKKRRKLGFLEDTQDGDFVAIPFSPKRHKGPLTERQREARAEQQQQRRGVSTYTNLDASQAPWASETQDEEEPPVQLGVAEKASSVFGGEEARTGFESLPTGAGVSGAALIRGGVDMDPEDAGGRGAGNENGDGPTALRGVVIGGEKGGDDEMEIDGEEAKEASSSEDMPREEKVPFFGAGGVPVRGGSTDQRGEHLGSDKSGETKKELDREPAVGFQVETDGAEHTGTPKADVKATAGPSGRRGGSPKVDEASGVQPGVPASDDPTRVEKKAGEQDDGGCAVAVGVQTVEQRPPSPEKLFRLSNEGPVRGSGNGGTDQNRAERNVEDRSLAVAEAANAEAPQISVRGSEGEVPQIRPFESTAVLSAPVETRKGAAPTVAGTTDRGLGNGSVKEGVATGALPAENAPLEREDGNVPASEAERSETLPLPETQEETPDEVRQLERAGDAGAEKALKPSALPPGEEGPVACAGVIQDSAAGKALETGANMTSSKKGVIIDTPAIETVPKTQPGAPQTPLINPAISAPGEQPAPVPTATASPPDAQTPGYRVSSTGLPSALPSAGPTPQATLNPVSEALPDPLPGPAPNPSANPSANKAQEAGPNEDSIRAINPAVKQTLNPATEPPVSGPVFPELVTSDAPVKNVLSNLPRSARQVLLAGAVRTVGDLAGMDCGELRKRMPIRAAVQTVRNALRAFRDREERRRANSQESPVVSQTPTDADDAPQPSDSDARIDGLGGRSHKIDGQDDPDGQKSSLPVKDEGPAEPEVRVAETQESVRSSLRASRKRSVRDGFDSAPEEATGEERGEGQREGTPLEGMEMKVESRGVDLARGSDPPTGVENGESGDGERKKRCLGPKVEPIPEAAASGGKPMVTQDETGREAASKARQQDGIPGGGGRERNLDIGGGNIVTGSRLDGAGTKVPAEGDSGAILPEQAPVRPCARSALRLAGIARGEEEPTENATIGGKEVTNGLGSEPRKLGLGGIGEVAAPLDPGNAAGAPVQGECSRSQGAPGTDSREVAIVANADGSPERQRDAQLGIVSRSVAGTALGNRVSEREPVALADKVQQLLMDPEWDALDVVGLVEAQLFVSDLGSKIAACLRARAPDHFSKK